MIFPNLSMNLRESIYRYSNNQIKLTCEVLELLILTNCSTRYLNVTKKKFIGYCTQGFVTWCAELPLSAPCNKQSLVNKKCTRLQDVASLLV